MTLQHDEDAERDRPGQPRLEGFDDVPAFDDDAGLPPPIEPPRRLDDPRTARRRPPPAPVVTHEGVYGTLPDRRRLEREYAESERPWRDTMVRLLAILLALAAGLWLALYSAHQATGEEVGRPALASIVDTMTGLPTLLEIHEEPIRETGIVPGYPLPATIPAEERDGGPARWRELLLDEATLLLYEDGVDAFNPESGVATDGTFSTSGGTKFLIDNLSTGRNRLADLLLWPAAIAAAVLAVGVIAVGSRFGRFQALGFALAVAGMPSIVLGALAYGLVAFAGTDGSALADTTHEIASSMAAIPIRNGVTLLLVGAGVGIAGRVMAAILDREPAPEPLFD